MNIIRFTKKNDNGVSEQIITIVDHPMPLPQKGEYISHESTTYEITDIIRRYRTINYTSQLQYIEYVVK